MCAHSPGLTPTAQTTLSNFHPAGTSSTLVQACKDCRHLRQKAVHSSQHLLLKGSNKEPKNLACVLPPLKKIPAWPGKTSNLLLYFGQHPICIHASEANNSIRHFEGPLHYRPARISTVTSKEFGGSRAIQQSSGQGVPSKSESFEKH